MLEVIVFAQGMGDSPPACLIVQQQQPGLGLLEDIGDIVGAVIGIEGDDHQPQPQCSLVEAGPLRTIAQAQGDPVPRLKAKRVQGSLPPGNLRPELFPAETTPPLRRFVEVTVGLPRGRAADALAQQAVEGLRLIEANEIQLPDYCILLISLPLFTSLTLRPSPPDYG